MPGGVIIQVVSRIKYPRYHEGSA